MPAKKKTVRKTAAKKVVRKKALVVTYRKDKKASRGGEHPERHGKTRAEIQKYAEYVAAKRKLAKEFWGK